jgi:hypothetical protein
MNSGFTQNRQVTHYRRQDPKNGGQLICSSSFPTLPNLRTLRPAPDKHSRPHFSFAAFAD